MLTFPDRYDDDGESEVRVVPVTRGVTCNNGARLFVTALELWRDFTVVHWAILRIDEPKEGYNAPHPDLVHPHIWMRTDSGNYFSGGSSGGSSGNGPFSRSTWEFDPVPQGVAWVEIGVSPSPPWNDWDSVSGDWIRVDLGRP